jgi:hypothetical protein
MLLKKGRSMRIERYFLTTILFLLIVLNSLTAAADCDWLAKRADAERLMDERESAWSLDTINDEAVAAYRGHVIKIYDDLLDESKNHEFVPEVCQIVQEAILLGIRENFHRFVMHQFQSQTVEEAIQGYDEQYSLGLEAVLADQTSYLSFVHQTSEDFQILHQRLREALLRSLQEEGFLIHTSWIESTSAYGLIDGLQAGNFRFDEAVIREGVMQFLVLDEIEEELITSREPLRAWVTHPFVYYSMKQGILKQKEVDQEALQEVEELFVREVRFRLQHDDGPALPGVPGAGRSIQNCVRRVYHSSVESVFGLSSARWSHQLPRAANPAEDRDAFLVKPRADLFQLSEEVQSARSDGD